MLVLCVKKAFCVKYNSFSRLYCSFGLCMGLERFVAKQQKTGGKHHEAWCSSPVSLYLKVRYVGLRCLLT